MKRSLLILFIIISIQAFSQNVKTEKPAIVFEKYGYIDGIRLDSIRSEYAEVNLLNNYILIDYGQQWVSRINYRVTDVEGNILRFSHNTIGAILNFMNYNGWEYINSTEPKDAMHYFIFRRKK